MSLKIKDRNELAVILDGDDIHQGAIYLDTEKRVRFRPPSYTTLSIDDVAAVLNHMKNFQAQQQ